jgi:hypothetical protein
MAYYLVQLAYTPEAWGAMAARPQNRLRRCSRSPASGGHI